MLRDVLGYLTKTGQIEYTVLETVEDQKLIEGIGYTTRHITGNRYCSI